MAEYIGVTVEIKLNDDRTTLRGKITQVDNTVLVLDDVFFPANNAYLPQYRVDGINIKDLTIVTQTPLESVPPYPSTPQHSHFQQFPPQPHPSAYSNVPGVSNYPPAQPQYAPLAPIPQPSAQAFEDPAIISMSKPPTRPAAVAQPTASEYLRPSPQLPQLPAVTTPTRSPAVPQTGSLQSAMSMSSGMAPKPSRSQSRSGPERKSTGGPDLAAAQAAFKDMTISGHTYNAAVESSAVEETDDGFGFSPMPASNARNQFAGKRTRRGKKPQQSFQGFQENANPTESTVVRPGMFAGAIAQAALGNVQTAQRKAPRKRRNQRARNEHGNYGTEEEGWATEDVNDYKSTEFDFQGNLDRFDKKTVFSQIKAEDTTAEGDRLVSHNRLPSKPPRKNFLNSENVLGQYANGQSLTEREGWTGDIMEESDESDDSDDVVGIGSGNAADSGRSSRRARSRASLSNSRMVRTVSSNNLTRVGSSENLPGSTKIPKPSFRLPTNRTCPIVTPLQMLDVERIAEVELGLTDDMMTENAGRAIAQVAIQAFGKRICATNFNALPVVLAMVGNTKSGARVIAACRHLRNHSVRVMIIGVGLERDDELLAGVRKQLTIFQNAGGLVGRWEEMQGRIQKFDAPPELIIDGLLGIHKDFDDLRTEDQATTYELVQFANKSKAAVLSVDIPSGIDGNTGEVADIQDTGTFYIRANIVVALGAPKTGLLQACISGIGLGWKLYVADIGIPNTAWRKYGTRRRHGVEFAADWIVGLHYHHYTIQRPE